MPTSTTHYSSPEQAPKATICVVGGTNVAHALARSSHVSASFTIDTLFGVSPLIYFGETSGVPFYHITLHGSIELSGVAEQEVLLRVWSALHQLGVSDALGGATAGSINEKYKLGDWVIADDFVDFNIDRQRSIAAAVLGGTSLFGGRGGVFGSIFGAVLVQTTSNGLVMLNANPYLYPLVNSVIIFIAAWVDGRRRLMTERLEQRKIRVEA